jgi:putative phosphoesterase
MKILVVSDVHANWEALRRIPDESDAVLFIGDLVDYGPRPKECIAWMRAHGATAVSGNHDFAVANRVSARCNPRFQPLADATADLMWRLLDEDELAYLRAFPLQRDVTLGGMRFHLVHAAPSDPLYTYLPPSEEARWAAEVERIDADVIVTGHTHLPMVLRCGRKLVVNPGSVGQPRERDPRAAYAVIADGEPLLERVAYEIEATVAQLQHSELAREVVDPLAHVLRTGTM